MPQHSHMHTNLILINVSTYTFMSYEDSVDYRLYNKNNNYVD